MTWFSRCPNNYLIYLVFQTLSNTWKTSLTFTLLENKSTMYDLVFQMPWHIPYFFLDFHVLRFIWNTLTIQN